VASLIWVVCLPKTFVIAPCFFFLSLLFWVLSFYKVWQGFISWFQFFLQIFGQCSIIINRFIFIGGFLKDYILACVET
jgi:hypothetical protein